MSLFRPRHVSMATLRNSFDRRSVVVGGVQGGIGVLLASRLGYLAIAQNEKYKLQSESNRVNLSLIPPRRGWIPASSAMSGGWKTATAPC
jgi:penicillin-binding protein 2